MSIATATGFGTSHKNEPSPPPGPPFALNSANNGLSVDSVSKKIVLGSDPVGGFGGASALLNNREIPMQGFGIKLKGNGSGDLWDLNLVSQRFFGAWLVPGSLFQVIPTSNIGTVSTVGNFNWTLNATAQGGDPDNNVLMWGYNQASGGGISNMGDSSVHFAIESWYAPSPGVNFKEVHMPQVNFLPTIITDPIVSVRVESHTINVNPVNRSINTDKRATRFNWFVLQQPIPDAATVIYSMVYGQSGVLSNTGFQPKFQLVDSGTGGVGTIEQNTDLEITSSRNIKLNSNGSVLSSANQSWSINGNLAIRTDFNFGECFVINDNAAAGQSVAIIQVQRLGNPILSFLSAGRFIIGSGDDGATLQIGSGSGGDFTTGDPGSGNGKWKVGQVQAGAAVLDAANFVEVMIDGVVKKLALIV